MREGGEGKVSWYSEVAKGGWFAMKSSRGVQEVLNCVWCMGGANREVQEEREGRAASNLYCQSQELFVFLLL